MQFRVVLFGLFGLFLTGTATAEQFGLTLHDATTSQGDKILVEGGVALGSDIETVGIRLSTGLGENTSLYGNIGSTEVDSIGGVSVGAGWLYDVTPMLRLGYGVDSSLAVSYHVWSGDSALADYDVDSWFLGLHASGLFKRTDQLKWFTTFGISHNTVKAATLRNDRTFKDSNTDALFAVGLTTSYRKLNVALEAIYVNEVSFGVSLRYPFF